MYRWENRRSVTATGPWLHSEAPLVFQTQRGMRVNLWEVAPELKGAKWTGVKGRQVG